MTTKITSRVRLILGALVWLVRPPQASSSILQTSMTYSVFHSSTSGESTSVEGRVLPQLTLPPWSWPKAPAALLDPLGTLRAIDLSALRDAVPYAYGCAMAGAISTAVSHTAVLPLDVLKTKMQSDRELGRLSPTAALRRVVHAGGPSQLLTGFSANAVGYFSQGAIKFGLYEHGKRCFSEAVARRFPNANVSETRWRVPIWIASSACAEVVASFALCPMEATKIRMVTDATYARSALGAFRRLLREEGVAALFRGTSPILIRQVPYTVAKLAGYEALSMCIGGGLLAGVIAGAAAATVSQPGDVILAKLCGGSRVARLEACYLSVSAVVSSLTLREFFVGLQPRATMCAAICAGQFFMYEALRPPKPADYNAFMATNS